MCGDEKRFATPGRFVYTMGLMRCSPLFLAAAAGASLLSLTGCGTTSRLARKAYHTLPFTHEEAPARKPGTASIRTRNLALKMQISPIPVKLSDVRQLQVRIRLENISKRYVQLEFPTTQRIEILVHGENGKLVTQWSEDRSFDPTVSYVGINPGEHLEYSTTIPTRDMQPGKKYIVQGFFPQFEALKTEQIVVPEA